MLSLKYLKLLKSNVGTINSILKLNALLINYEPGLSRCWSRGKSDSVIEEWSPLSVTPAANNDSTLLGEDSKIAKMEKLIPKEVDVLAETISKCQYLDDFMKLIDDHVVVMNTKHLALCFHLFDERFKLSGSGIQRKEITESLIFDKLCKRTMKRLRYFEASDLITILKSLARLQISANTGIVRGILQLLRHHLQDLTVEQILYLDYLFSKFNTEEEAEFESTSQINYRITSSSYEVPMMAAIQLALPLLLQIKLDAKEFDPKDISTVIKCIRKGALKGLKANTLNKLMKITLHSIEMLNPYTAVNLIAALASPRMDKDLELDTQLVEKLLDECFACLSNKLGSDDNLNFFVKDVFLKYIIRKDHDRYYHKMFYKKYSNWISCHLDQVGLIGAYNTLTHLAKFDHYSPQLLEAFPSHLVANKNEYIQSKFMYPAKILQAYVTSDFDKSTTDWDSFCDALLDPSKLQSLERDKLHTLGLIKNLIMLNDYKRIDQFENNLIQIVNELIISSESGLKDAKICENILSIYTGLCLENSSASKIVEAMNYLIRGIINTQSKQKQENSSSLVGFLELAFGGKDFVRSGVWTNYGQYIDHLIILRKGDYPIALHSKNKNETITFLESFTAPPESKM